MQSESILPASSFDKEPVQKQKKTLNRQIVCLGTLDHVVLYFLLSHFLFLLQMPSSGSLDTRVWNYLEASILHVRSQKYYGIPYFFTNNSGIPHYFIMEFHIKHKLWKSEITCYCPFITNFHSCSEPRIVLNWGHMLNVVQSLVER